MENVKMTVKDDKLTIEVDLSKELGPSKSGKTIVIGSTKGIKPVPKMNEIKVGLNVFKYPDKKEE